LGASILHYGSSTYPTYLTETEDAPPILFAMGQTDLCNKPPLAMVGTRHASTAGKNFAHDLARATAQAGFCIVSGMARGIDAAVHVGALPYGTIAVLAGGIDVIYPKENTKLYHALASRGLILSEAPIGTTPQARHFPSRNRIIAGISLGTLVFEAALRSGSLITARMAADYGREVLAIPGHPADGRAAGGNALLKDGAALVENVDDIIQHMADILANPTMHMQFTTATQHSKATTTQVPPRNTGALANPSALLESPRSSTTHADQSTACRHWVMDTLGTTPTTQDDLIRQSKRAPATIATALLELELAGKIERRPGGVIAPTAFVRNNA
jgi:DNA processing protein